MQEIFIWALNGVTGMFVILLWSWMKDIKAKADKATEDLAAYKIEVAEKYTTGEELREAVNSLNRAFESYSTKLDTRLDRIEAKLDRKADKKE